MRKWNELLWEFVWIPKLGGGRDIPQDSVLGPLLWIIISSRVQTTCLPTCVATVGFTDFVDGIEVTVVVCFFKEEKICLNEAIYNRKSWLGNPALSLREYKMEVILITKGRRYTSIDIKIGTQIIPNIASLRYSIYMYWLTRGSVERRRPKTDSLFQLWLGRSYHMPSKSGRCIGKESK